MALALLREKIRSAPVLTVAILAISILIFVGIGLYIWGNLRPTTNLTETAGQKALYWRSAMNPTEIYNEPGKDRMGMDLVPVYQKEDSAAPPGSIRINPTTVQNIGVKTSLIERKPFGREIRTIGQVTYDEEKVRRISPKFGGWIEKQYVNFTGQTTNKGQNLLDIYSPELVATQEEYLVALQYFDQLKGNKTWDIATGAKDLLQSTEARLRYWDISEAQLRALRIRGEITRTMSLFAPFKGIIVKKNIPEGGYVRPGQTLYEIAELSTVWVLADIYEYEAPWLQLGQEAEMTLAYTPGTIFRGKVTYIYPYLKNQTRTLQVRIEFSNTEDFLFKPGMWTNVTLRTKTSQTSLTVPVQAVMRTGKRDIALVALEGSHFAPRELRLGIQSGDDFEVLDGLEEGDRVVTSAQFLINSESSLQSAISKMLPPQTEKKATQELDQQPPPNDSMPDMKMPAPTAAMPDMKMVKTESDQNPAAKPRHRKGD